MSKQGEAPILLISMFSGSHPVDNIAHEIINVFKTDNEENYIYVPRNGGMSKDTPSGSMIDDSLENGGVVKVLMLHHLDVGCYEVLGRAIIGKGGLCSQDEDDQKELLNSIQYDEQSIGSIMEKVGQKFDGVTEKITFKADQCSKPPRPITVNLIKDEKKKDCCKAFYDEDGKLIELSIMMLSKPDQGKKRNPRNLFRNQREYILPKNSTNENKDRDQFIQPHAYDQLDRLFQDEGWEDFPTVSDYRKQFNYQNNKDVGFLSLINKQDSELAYSDLLVHFLDENEDLSRLFIKKLLKAWGVEKPAQGWTDKDLIPFDIVREKSRIDILINTVDRLFILENKVDASLRESLDEESNKHQKPADGQLQDYVNAVKKELDKKGQNKEITAFILCPKRNKLYKDYIDYFDPNSNRGLVRTIEIGDQKHNVPVISYSDVYDILQRIGKVNGGAKENEYYNDFKAMVKWQDDGHQKYTSSKILNLSYKRFLRAVQIAGGTHD